MLVYTMVVFGDMGSQLSELPLLPLKLQHPLLRLKPGRSVMLMPKLTPLSFLLPPLSHTLLSPTLSHMPLTEPTLVTDIHMPMDLDMPHMDTLTLDMLDLDIMDLDIMEDKNLPTSFICNFKELNPKSYFG